MDWSDPFFILSQIAVIGAMVCLGVSFFSKRKAVILLLSICLSMFMALSHGFLLAWVGLGISIVSVFRTTTFYLVDRFKKDKTKTKKTWVDWFVFILFAVVMLVVSWFTQGEWYTWFAFAGGIIYHTALWLKHFLWFRILGIFGEIAFFVFAFFYDNVLAMVMGAVMLSLIFISLTKYTVKHVQKKRVAQDTV